jgi:hypothetical protein
MSTLGFDAPPTARDGVVRATVLAVPIAALVAGAAASLFDLRLGVVATVFVIGWTKLVGL